MTSFDISPTRPLSGLHLQGNVTRRFLINYPVPPDALAPFLPPGAELSIWGGSAWVSACFVNTRKMRPSPVPEALGGMEFNYLIHRTRALLPYPDGKMRESVLVLEANINRKFFLRVGRIVPGIDFKYRDVSLVTTADSYIVTMKDGDTLLYQVEIPRTSFKRRLPKGSKFADLEQADNFLLGVSYGGQWQARSNSVKLFAETHKPWTALVGTAKTGCNAFLEGLGQHTEADNVITMTHIPHYFAMFGSNVKV